MLARWLSRGPVRAAALALAAVVLGLGCKPKIGDPCSVSTDCSINGDRLCDTTQPGGYCTQFNCEPGTCPDEATCVAYNSEICSDPLRPPRFQRTFCMFMCDGDGDCRSGYACIDKGASVTDIAPPTRKVCTVPVSIASPSIDTEAGVCLPPVEFPDASGPLPDSSGPASSEAGDGADSGDEDALGGSSG